MKLLLANLSAKYSRLAGASRWGILTACALLALPGQSQTPNPLALGLISFTAVPTGCCATQLRWTMAQELHSLAGFVVERSPDGHSFQPLISLISQAGTGSCKYSASDTTLTIAANTWTYYRLRLCYLDGTNTYSPVRVTQRPKAATRFAVFPTLLAESLLHYQYAGVLSADAVLRVYNNRGK